MTHGYGTGSDVPERITQSRIDSTTGSDGPQGRQLHGGCQMFLLEICLGVPPGEDRRFLMK